MALSDEARAAIKDAVNIVREDRMERFLRSRFANKAGTDSDDKGKVPPEREGKEPPSRKGAWWGEFDSGDRS